MEARMQQGLQPAGQPRPQSSDYHNISDRERRISLALGAASLAYGLRRGGAIGWAAGLTGGFLGQRALTGHCYASQMVGRNTARRSDRGLFSSQPLHLRTEVTIARPPEELYRFWRDFTRLPSFMKYITEVKPTGGNRTRWIAEGPWADQTGRLEWESEVTEDRPNERIAWRSVEGSDVDQQGEIRFRPTGRGTEVQLELQYSAPPGRISAALGRFLNTLSKEAAREDLRRFKQLMESGELPTNATTREQSGRGGTR